MWWLVYGCVQTCIMMNGQLHVWCEALFIMHKIALGLELQSRRVVR